MKAKGLLSLIRNADVYAPEPMGIKTLLIAGGTIVSISDDDIDLPASLDVTVVDLEGRAVIPGLIDAHAHITGGGGEAGFATQVPALPISHFTRAGVTTVVGLLGTDDTTRSTENLLARVYGLREEGLSSYCWTGGYHFPLTTLTGSAKTDIVYIEPIIGIGEFAISDHRSSQPSYEEVIRLASEAHVAGLITGKAGIVHFHLGDGDRKLALIERALAETELPARVFNPTHVNRNKPLFEQSCQLLSKGCYIDLTAFPEGACALGWSAAEAIAILIDQNLPLSQVTVSSDGGGCLPRFDERGEMTRMDFGRCDSLIDTLQQCLNTEIKLEQVLPLFTSNVASLLRLKQKGRLQEGADADLIVLNSDHSIGDVMAMGRWHVRHGQQQIKGLFE